MLQCANYKRSNDKRVTPVVSYWVFDKELKIKERRHPEDAGALFMHPTRWNPIEESSFASRSVCWF